MFTFSFKDPHSTLTVEMTTKEDHWPDLLPIVKQFLQASGFHLPEGELRFEDEDEQSA